MTGLERSQVKTEQMCREWHDEMTPQKLDEVQWLEFASTAYDKRANGIGFCVQFLESWGGPASGYWMTNDGTLYYWAQNWGTHSHILETRPEIIEWFHCRVDMEDVMELIADEEYETLCEEDDSEGEELDLLGGE